MNQTHFDRFTMILRSAGFRDQRLDPRTELAKFSYIFCISEAVQRKRLADLEQLVHRWYVVAVLRGRYTGSPESAFNYDIRQIEWRAHKFH